MANASAEAPIKAYWQPGCTSCLRMKEFLTKHGVPFVSVNVLEDKTAFAELAELGIRSVPIVRRGTDWANGQVLKDVARVAGIAWGGAKILPPAELVARLIAIQTAAQRLLRADPGRQARPAAAQPAAQLRPARLPHLQHRRRLPRARGAGPAAEGGRLRPRAAARDEDQGADPRLRPQRAGGLRGPGGRGPGKRPTSRARPTSTTATSTLHEFLERTTWHSGQHVRQLMMVLGHARHRARPAGRQGDLRRPADARQGLGRREAGGRRVAAC